MWALTRKSQRRYEAAGNDKLQDAINTHSFENGWHAWDHDCRDCRVDECFDRR